MYCKQSEHNKQLCKLIGRCMCANCSTYLNISIVTYFKKSLKKKKIKHFFLYGVKKDKKKKKTKKKKKKKKKKKTRRVRAKGSYI
jgi:hypothetical protein